MDIVRIDPDQIIEIKGVYCACIGYFDGLHRGHQKLIEETVRCASAYNTKKAVITFDTDPLEVITGQTQKQIISRDTLFMMVAEKGIDTVFLIDFSKKTASLSPEDFIDRVLNKLQLQALICGFDFHYGYKGAGNVSSLRSSNKKNFTVVEVEEVVEDGRKISSTTIKALLQQGDIRKVNNLLGYTYNIEGEVIHGLNNGHRLGFPTVNIRYDDYLCLPKDGVYAGYAAFGGQRYKAMINLGHNPTIKEGSPLTLEAHILDYRGDLYGYTVKLLFQEYIRPDYTFSSLQELIEQLNKDKETVLNLKI